jgi:hypothetical protein
VDPLRHYEETYSLLATQIPYLDLPRFHGYRAAYLQAMGELHRRYAELAPRGLLAPYQREIWFSILRAWSRLVPPGSPRPWLNELPLYWPTCLLAI